MPTMTAAQRRAADKADYDVFLAQCPSRQLLDRLSDKWVTLVLCALEDKPQRYSAARPHHRRGQPEDAHPDPAHAGAGRDAHPQCDRRPSR